MIRSYKEDSVPVLPDLTAMLDIIFIVMVFLILTASVHINSLDITLPTTHDNAVLTPSEEAVITLNILSEAPYWALEETPYQHFSDLTAALHALKAEHPERSLLIGADDDAPAGQMIKLLAYLKQHPFPETHIMMDETQ